MDKSVGNRLHSVGISPPSAGVFHTIHRLSHKTGWDFGFPQLLFPDLPVERCGKRGFHPPTPRAGYPPVPPISASENGGGKRNILYNCRFFRKIRPIPRTRRTVAVEKSGKVPVLPPFFQTPARRATRDFSSVLATVSHNSTNFRLQLQEIFGHFREKFHFSTILPPLRRLRLRTNLNISIYKKNNRCADTLLMREIPALRWDYGVRLRRADTGCAFSRKCRMSRRACKSVHKVFAPLGQPSESLLMHRPGAGLFRDLSRILFMHRLGASASEPRGGGQRDRRRTLRSPSPISPTPLNLFPGLPLRRGHYR